jgi:hypothetical protein
MDKQRSCIITIFAIVIFIIGLSMFSYWTKYILDGMPLQNIPIMSEGIAAILALTTGIGLFRMRKWSFVTGILLSGFWMYGCIGGINLVIYDLLVLGKINFQSPVGAWFDAFLFVIITCFATYFVCFLWNKRKLLLQDDIDGKEQRNDK